MKLKMLSRKEILRIELRLSSDGQANIGRQVAEHDEATRGLIDDLKCDVEFWKNKADKLKRIEDGEL